MLPAAQDPSFQTEDVSILKQLVVWNCVKMSMILLFSSIVKTRRFSDETGFIFEIFLLVEYSKILVFYKA